MFRMASLVLACCLCVVPSLSSADELEALREEVRYLLSVELDVDELFLPWYEKRFQQLGEEQLFAILSSRSPVLEAIRVLGEPTPLLYRVLDRGCRVLDTRRQVEGPLEDGEERTFWVRGNLDTDQGLGSNRSCGVSADAVAVTLNLVAVNAQGHGNLALVASDDTSFGTASINFGPGRSFGGVDVVNGVTVKLCSVGCDMVNRDLRISARNTTVDAVINVSGFFVPLEEVPAQDLVCVDCVSGSEIADGSVTSADILDGAITGTDIADGTLTSADIQDGSITGIDITDGTIRSVDIQDGTITGTDIEDGSITAADLADGSVTSSDISDGTIRSVDVQDGSLTGTDIEDGSITTADLRDGGIFSIDVADGTLRSDDIQDGTITGIDIADGSITAADIQDGALTGRDIADGTLLAPDIDLGYQITECSRQLIASSISALECDCLGTKKIRGGGCVATTANVDLFENFPYKSGLREGWQCTWRETAGASGAIAFVRAICADG